MHGLPMQHLSYWRNPPYTAVSVFFTTYIALMFGRIFLDLGSKKVVIELPYILAQCTVDGLIVYSMIGFEWTAAKFFWYLFFMYFTNYGMMSVGLDSRLQLVSSSTVNSIHLGFFFSKELKI